MYPEANIPTIHFDYNPLESLFKIPPKTAPATVNEQHRARMLEWSKFWTHEENIWVGRAVLPVGLPNTQDYAVLRKVRAYTSCMAHDARAAFSCDSVYTSKVARYEKFTEDNGVVKSLKVLSQVVMPDYPSIPWLGKIHTDLMSIPGFLVHPPQFFDISTSMLMPSFKDTVFVHTIEDDWEMILASKLPPTVAVPQATSLLRMDMRGRLIVSRPGDQAAQAQAPPAPVVVQPVRTTDPNIVLVHTVSVPTEPPKVEIEVVNNSFINEAGVEDTITDFAELATLVNNLFDDPEVPGARN